jgi:putative SOS response-associated peptidase YedK
MSSRYVLNHPPHLLQQWYEILRMPDFHPHYNIAPGSTVLVVRATPTGRVCTASRWGFIPSWADDPSCVPMLHNARSETVAEKPMFRKAFRGRRCLIPASGYYEWQSASGRKLKQPYYISLRDGAPLSFAGLWDSALTTSGEAVDTCAIVTTKANTLIEPIHHRMPVLLARESWSAWLDPDTAVPNLLALLQPYPSEQMQAWEVADAVNRALNDDPALLLPRAGSKDGGVQPALL